MRLKNEGFTLVEVMIATGILATIITGMIRLFILTSIQSDLAGEKTAAISEAQSKLEEIRSASYDLIPLLYGSGSGGDVFDPILLDGKGVIYIDSSNTELTEMEVVISWRSDNGRVIGEDLNLDGDLDPGEDLNGNNKLDSPAQLATMITRR